MSLLARRVEQIFAEKPTFNVFKDNELVDFIEQESEAGFYEWLHQGSGIVSVPVPVMRKALRMAKQLKLGQETVEQIREDITYAKTHGDDAIDYACF